MKTVAVVSQKGGAGKTTLALHLAVAAELAGTRCAVVDLDPQASAAGWKDHRQAETPAVVSAQAVRLPQVLDAARQGGAGLAVIDTAPHSEGASLAAIRAAELVLIPCRPAILDLRAIGSSVDLVRLAGRPGVIVLNAVPPRGSAVVADATAAAAAYGLAVAPVHIGQRAAYGHSLTAGLTAQEYEAGGKAAEDIARLYAWLCEHAGL